VDPELIEIDTNKYMIATKFDQTNFSTRPLFNITFEIRNYTRLPDGTVIKTKV